MKTYLPFLVLALFALAVGLARVMAGAAPPPASRATVGESVPSPVGGVIVSVSPIPEESPRWRRRYSVILPRGLEMRVEMRSYGGLYDGGERYDHSTLTQPDGKWLLFNLDAPADKILDQGILPFVDAAAREIRRQDAAFMATARHQFVDETGVIWTSATKEKR